MRNDPTITSCESIPLRRDGSGSSFVFNGFPSDSSPVNLARRRFGIHFFGPLERASYEHQRYLALEALMPIDLEQVFRNGMPTIGNRDGRYRRGRRPARCLDRTSSRGTRRRSDAHSAGQCRCFCEINPCAQTHAKSCRVQNSLTETRSLE